MLRRDFVLGGMKCGIADMSAGGSDMVDGLRIGFAYRGSIGIKMESLETFWPGCSPEVEW